jgi:hypothetical protein
MSAAISGSRWTAVRLCVAVVLLQLLQLSCVVSAWRLPSGDVVDLSGAAAGYAFTEVKWANCEASAQLQVTQLWPSMDSVSNLTFLLVTKFAITRDPPVLSAVAWQNGSFTAQGRTFNDSLLSSVVPINGAAPFTARSGSLTTVRAMEMAPGIPMPALRTTVTHYYDQNMREIGCVRCLCTIVSAGSSAGSHALAELM